MESIVDTREKRLARAGGADKAPKTPGGGGKPRLLSAEAPITYCRVNCYAVIFQGPPSNATVILAPPVLSIARSSMKPPKIRLSGSRCTVT